MPKNYVIGFPRIGKNRELKFVLESYFKNEVPFETVQEVAKTLRHEHWKMQHDAGIEQISCNDFSLYDNMLDTTVMFNAIAERFTHLQPVDQYFAMARGTQDAVAMQMSKWFNTNYHYIVPELSDETPFALNASKLLNELDELLEFQKEYNVNIKVNIIGPLTFLALSRHVNKGSTLSLLPKLLPLYCELIDKLSKYQQPITLQIEEPIFCTDLDDDYLNAITSTYETLATHAKHLTVAVITYFDHATEAVPHLLKTAIDAIGLDFVYSQENLRLLPQIAQSDKRLIVGIIDGKNIWHNSYETSLKLLEKITTHLPKERLTLSTSSSLLHLPYTTQHETKMSRVHKAMLCFVDDKLQELSTLSRLFFDECTADERSNILKKNSELLNHQQSFADHPAVQEALQNITQMQRTHPFSERISQQKSALKLPILPTTTIGSFPQTDDLRQARRAYKTKSIDKATYDSICKRYIKECISLQEKIGLDVLVHGEPERNDMVEYFAEHLKGYLITQFGWVQSYGTRCVKPPIIYGDIYRVEPITLPWIRYAQSLTNKPVKGMLTGPVTMVNWSFVRNDLNVSDVSKQIALCLRDEINDLQQHGISIIQVDEAAFKEGYPLRKINQKAYEQWALRDFKLTVSSALPTTQIHTHMCYSDFNDMIETIEAMDADVISIETAKSGNQLLDAFEEQHYKQEIGPGVYDIHSPRIVQSDEMFHQIETILKRFDVEKIWVNPDCGLKTRNFEEVTLNLTHMVNATKEARAARSVP